MKQTFKIERHHYTNPWDLAKLTRQVDPKDKHYVIKVANLIKGYEHGVKGEEALDSLWRYWNHSCSRLASSFTTLENALKDLRMTNDTQLDSNESAEIRIAKTKLYRVGDAIESFIKKYNEVLEAVEERGVGHKDTMRRWMDEDTPNSNLKHSYEKGVDCKCWEHKFDLNVPNEKDNCDADKEVKDEN